MKHAARLYSVTEVLDTVGITHRTLRIYEEYGLIGPAESEGESRLYLEETVDTLLRIQRIREDLGVNLAGVQVILDMRKRIEELQQGMEELVEFVRVDLKQEMEQFLRRQEKAVLPGPLARPPQRRDED